MKSQDECAKHGRVSFITSFDVLYIIMLMLFKQHKYILRYLAIKLYSNIINNFCLVNVLINTYGWPLDGLNIQLQHNSLK